ncbi:hypothetical protein LIER_13688 [Lithospermum erythrorhizon]|uniref:Uncharacterized protein n=1 Tax=Lithospermum erythrorhizon TaxID=34254 RepID=A0AAV3PWB1_LITER
MLLCCFEVEGYTNPSNPVPTGIQAFFLGEKRSGQSKRKRRGLPIPNRPASYYGKEERISIHFWLSWPPSPVEPA